MIPNHIEAVWNGKSPINSFLVRSISLPTNNVNPSIQLFLNFGFVLVFRLLVQRPVAISYLENLHFHVLMNHKFSYFLLQIFVALSFSQVSMKDKFANPDNQQQ